MFFALAVFSELFPVAARVSDVDSYSHFPRYLNLRSVNFPVNLKDIALFENLNNISINVYVLVKYFKNNKVVYQVTEPLSYIEYKLRLHINLLYLTNGTNSYGYYCWIMVLSRLLSRQVS